MLLIRSQYFRVVFTRLGQWAVLVSANAHRQALPPMRPVGSLGSDSGWHSLLLKQGPLFVHITQNCIAL